MNAAKDEFSFNDRRNSNTPLPSTQEQRKAFVDEASELTSAAMTSFMNNCAVQFETSDYLINLMQYIFKEKMGIHSDFAN